MTAKPAAQHSAEPFNGHTQQYFSAPEDFGCYTCADDYEDAQRNRCHIIEDEMP